MYWLPCCWQSAFASGLVCWKYVSFIVCMLRLSFFLLHSFWVCPDIRRAFRRGDRDVRKEESHGRPDRRLQTRRVVFRVREVRDVVDGVFPEPQFWMCFCSCPPDKSSRLPKLYLELIPSCKECLSPKLAYLQLAWCISGTSGFAFSRFSFLHSPRGFVFRRIWSHSDPWIC